MSFPLTSLGCTNPFLSMLQEENGSVDLNSDDDSEGSDDSEREKRLNIHTGESVFPPTIPEIADPYHVSHKRGTGFA